LAVVQKMVGLGSELPIAAYAQQKNWLYPEWPLSSRCPFDFALAAKVGSPPKVSIDICGPNRTFPTSSIAAAQFHQTGHSLIAQNFVMLQTCSTEQEGFLNLWIKGIHLLGA
jgi:hypothetical protein